MEDTNDHHNEHVDHGHGILDHLNLQSDRVDHDHKNPENDHPHHHGDRGDHDHENDHPHHHSDHADHGHKDHDNDHPDHHSDRVDHDHEDHVKKENEYHKNDHKKHEPSDSDSDHDEDLNYQKVPTEIYPFHTEFLQDLTKSTTRKIILTTLQLYSLLLINQITLKTSFSREPPIV